MNAAGYVLRVAGFQIEDFGPGEIEEKRITRGEIVGLWNLRCVIWNVKFKTGDCSQNGFRQFFR